MRETSPDPLCSVQPGKRAVKRINAKLTELTRRNLTPIPLPIIVRRVNQSLRGWSCYFDYANSSKIFGDVKRHAEERLRTHLRKRHKVKARRVGQGRFPNRVLLNVVVCTNFQRRLPGRGRMRWHEEHRKAVYGKTVCTV